MDDLIKEINFLANLSKKRKLTPPEIKKQQKLRNEFLAIFHKNFKQQLQNIKKVNTKKGKDDSKTKGN